MNRILQIGFLMLGCSLSAQTLTLDESFNPPSAGIQSNRTVNDVLIQPDGKILVVGTFNSFAGITTDKILRLNSDGSLDTTFNAGSGANGSGINAIALDGSGMIYIGGDFTMFGNTPRKALVRLFPDGSLDTTFTVNFSTSDTKIFDIVLDNSGRILVGGRLGISFPGSGGCNALARINQDGSVDTTFDTSFQDYETVYTVAVQPEDNKILAGGFLFNNTTSGLVRLNVDGSKDTAFLANYSLSGYLYDIFVQQDNKIILGGRITAGVGVNHVLLERLNFDGSKDVNFESFVAAENNSLDDLIEAVVPYNGKLLVGGKVYSYNGIQAGDLMLINNDGTAVENFDIGDGFQSMSTDYLSAIALDSNDNVVVAGAFESYDNIPVYNLARLSNSGLDADDFFKSKPLVYRSGEGIILESDENLGTVEIYDSMGRKVLSQSDIASNYFCASGIPDNQILVIRIQQGKKVSIVKAVK